MSVTETYDVKAGREEPDAHRDRVGGKFRSAVRAPNQPDAGGLRATRLTLPMTA